MFAGFLGTIKKILQGCVFLLVGILLTILYYHAQGASEPNCQKNYPLTSPELDCDYDEVRSRLDALDTKLEEAVAHYLAEGRANKISVWVRDLNSKQWAAVNETEMYSPASLLKVPIMLAYYKLSELDIALLGKTIVYQKPAGLDDGNLHFTATSTLVSGNTYTAEELIEYMIKGSDNAATLTLIDNIDPALFKKTMVDLGLQIPTKNRTIKFVNVKSYANIFRILYNASYINRDLSQKALSLMGESTFKGISAPLPVETTVTHKFGEQTLENDMKIIVGRELHDCGIVYKGEHPYSLCVMTEGSDFDKLLSVITELSSLVYNQL
jgi:beta-lactamase class A